MGTRQVPDRTNQKDRTRKSLVEAAAAMMRRGQTPTVAAAAEAAGVHRATAYRYFPNIQLLLAEAGLEMVDLDLKAVLAGVPPDDSLALIDAAVAGVSQHLLGDEALFRRNILVTLERWLDDRAAGGHDDVPVRSNRRFTWIDPVIEPWADTMDPDLFRRLRYGLALTFGAEAVIVTRDVCRLDPDEATEIMRWAAGSLIRSAMAENSGCADPEAEAAELGHG